MSDHIQYDFLYDNQFAELKESELLNGRLGTLATIEPYIGKYYSAEYVRKRILRQTDSEILEIDLQIDDEIKRGIIPDPNGVDPVTGQALPPEEPAAGNGTEGMGQDAMNMGEVPAEPDLETQGAVTDAEMQKDVKKAQI